MEAHAINISKLGASLVTSAVKQPLRVPVTDASHCLSGGVVKAKSIMVIQYLSSQAIKTLAS